MLRHLRRAGAFAWELLTEFVADDCPRMAAALSFYSVFAMPAMLGLLALLANRFISPDDLHRLISAELTALTGAASAARVVTIVDGIVRPQFAGPVALIGFAAFLFAATAAFSNLQGALNTAWGVRPHPKRGDVRPFLIKRVMSLVMIGALGVLVLASVLASGFLAVVHGLFSGVTPAWLRSPLLRVAEVFLSFAALSLVVAAVLRWVPDALVRWRDALAGGAFTSALFTVGKLLIGWYLTRRDLGNVYGAASSLAVALLWIYYSAIILLLGAEFTQLWAHRRGEPVVPHQGAVRVMRQIVYMDGEAEGEVQSEVQGAPEGEEQRASMRP